MVKGFKWNRVHGYGAFFSVARRERYKPAGQLTILLIQQDGCGVEYKLHFLTGLLNFLSIASSKLPMRSSKPIINGALKPVIQHLEHKTDRLSSRSV